jgi:hypothetical protein
MAVPRIEMAEPAGARARRRIVDIGLMLGLAVVLLVLFVGPTVRQRHAFPVGPDVPVYLWWSRVATEAGVPAVGERPGIAALIPTIAATLRLELVPALAGLTYAAGIAIGLAGAALVRGRGALTRPAWMAGGFLAGVWATHLADGYAANLSMAAPFIAAAVALTRRTRRGTIVAAIALAGGGLMHPQFFVVGAAVLLLTAAWAALRDRRISVHTGDAGRVLAALAAAGLTVGLGLVAAAGTRIEGDTSKDAFLRRNAQWATLRRTYVDRFRLSWPRYAPIMNTFLVVTGVLRGRGFARRFLVAWMTFTVVAVVTGVGTGWFPPDRVLTFAFCIPLLASLGLAWIEDRFDRWWLAWPVGIALVVLTAAPTIRAWEDAHPFISPDELRTATIAGRIAADTPAGTPLVFVVDDPDTPATFLMSHARNVARAAVPPGRAGDVYVVVGRAEDVLAGRVTQKGQPMYDLAARDTSASIPSDPPPVIFVLEEFDARPGAIDTPSLTRWDLGLASTAAPARPLPPGEGELAASTPGTITGATVRAFVLLTLLGFGWAAWSLGPGASSLAVSPALGIAVLGLTALALERLGAGVGGAGPGTLASALAGAGGYAAWLARRSGDRRRRRDLDLLVEGHTVPDP